MEEKRANSARRLVTHAPGAERLPRSDSLLLQEASRDELPSPVLRLTSRVSTRRSPKLVISVGVCALSVAAAGLMALRPTAPAQSSTPGAPGVGSDRQPAASLEGAYAVHVGPYHQSRAVLLAHKELTALGLQPFLIRGGDGTYLRVPTPPTERDAQRVARGLREHGYNALVVETTPDAAPGGRQTSLAGALHGGNPQYHVDGVLVGFEGGQTKGWDGAGSITGIRNSSLFAFQGEHSLEVSLAGLTLDTPGQLRFKPESVVLPQDVFVAQVLLPQATPAHVGVRWYVADANGKSTLTSPLPLRPRQWIATRLTILPRVALPIQEMGLEMTTARGDRWSGTVYIDNVEQQRAR